MEGCKAARVLCGLGLTAGLFAFGFYVTGASPARAWARLNPTSPADGLHVLGGALQRQERVQLNGRPADVLLCYHPARTPAAVLDHYAKQAADETPVGLPYLREDDPDGGGSVLWVTPEGIRKAVLAAADPAGGARFRLLAEPGPPPLPGAPPPQDPTAGAHPDALPGGLAPPDGLRVGFCLTRADGTGTCVLETEGACRDVAARLLVELERAGFAPQQRELEAFRQATPDTRVFLPLRHASGGLLGTLAVTPSETGARATLTVRSAG